MIKKIKSIKNIRNFIDFTCEEELAKQNVIYAFNGTGKTNLSRIFSCFQSDTVDLNILNSFLSLEAIEKKGKIDFNIEFSTGVFVNPLNPKIPANHHIFVYNDDFISKNIDISNFTDNKKHNGEIIIGKVGADAIKIDALEKEIATFNENIKVENKKIEDLLSEGYKVFLKTNKAKDSQFYQSIFTIEKYKNDSAINKFKEKFLKYSPVENLKNIENIDDSNQITPNLKLIDLTIDFTEIEKILHKSFKFEDIKEDVEKHIKKVTKKWIEDGLLNHQNDICPFCLQSTSGIAIIKAYDEYIKSEKSLLLTKLSDFKRNIVSVISIIKSNNTTCDSEFTSKINSLISTLGLTKKYNELPQISSLEEEFEVLSFMIESKESNLEETFPDDIEFLLSINKTISQFINSYNDLIKQNIQLISTINQKLTSTGERKTELRKEISELELLNIWNASSARRLEISKFVKAKAESERQLAIERSKSTIKEKKGIIVEIQNRLLTSIGLTKYKIDNDFSLKLRASREFNISSRTNLISQGEKSVIAFTYFLAHVIQRIDKYEEIENSVFVIDDPVSSTSYNFLHGIADVIKNIAKVYKLAFDIETNNNLSPQIIITTHNIQFYNILQSNVYKKFGAFFALNKHIDKTELSRIRNHKKLSEYMTSLRRLKQFSDNKIDDNVAGDLRKVIETICSFYYPSYDLSKEQLDKIFDKELSLNLKLIADDFIHGDFNNHEEPFDSNTLKNATNELLILLKDKFKGQLEYIEQLN